MNSLMSFFRHDSFTFIFTSIIMSTLIYHFGKELCHSYFQKHFIEKMYKVFPYRLYIGTLYFYRDIDLNCYEVTYISVTSCHGCSDFLTPDMKTYNTMEDHYEDIVNRLTDVIIKENLYFPKDVP